MYGGGVGIARDHFLPRLLIVSRGESAARGVGWADHIDRASMARSVSRLWCHHAQGQVR